MKMEDRDAIIDVRERAERLLDWIYSSETGSYTIRRCGVLDPLVAQSMDAEYERNLAAARLLERRGEVLVWDGGFQFVVQLNCAVRRVG